MLASLVKINKYYNGVRVLNDVSLTIEDDSRIGLIGVNGCGKSTLLRILTGSEYPDRTTEEDGIVNISSKTSIGFLKQDSMLECDGTVYEEMRGVFADIDEIGRRMTEAEHKMAECGESELAAISEEYDMLRTRFEAADGYLTDVKIKTVLGGMGFSPEEYGRDVQSFSGGEKTRLAIAKLLLEEPNLLILDEPTNHLDFQTVLWLEDYLLSYKGAVLVVSHDRYFLDKITSSVCEIERGRLTQYKGNYTKFTQLKAEASARQLKEYEAQQKEIAKLEDYVARNLVRASTTKAAQSRRRTLEKMELVEKPLNAEKGIKLEFTPKMLPPFDLLFVREVEIAVGEGENRKLLAHDVSFDMKRGERLAIVGTNGTGKSTLLKVLMKQLPATGRIKWSDNVKISYFEQESAQLNPENTALEELHSRYPLLTELELRSLLGRVRLTGENVFKKISMLSGGERIKLCFAIIMQEHGNVLILDEPTNHLDLSAKEMLEAALCEYEGSIIFVSHDRYLLKRLAGRILEIESGCAQLYEGGFDKYMSEKVSEKKLEQQKRDSERIEQQQITKQKSGVKSKQQRSLEASRRNRVRELEGLIAACEEKSPLLEAELASEEVYSDFQKLNDKCAELEAEKKALDEYYDEWASLSE